MNIRASEVESKFVRSIAPSKLEQENRTPTVISLFSGAGGMDLGVRLAGFEVRVMVEWEHAACETLRLNWIKPPGYKKPEKVKREKPLYDGDDWSNVVDHDWFQDRDPAILERDITKTTTDEILEAAELEIGEATLLTGGFPCQGFSMAGRRVIDDPRNRLYKECVRVLREALPQSFMFENVPGLASMNGGKVIKQICDDFAASGYSLRWEILNAADYGVPQHRKRVFFVGKRQDIMALDAETGRTAVHMGAVRGDVEHPAWFKKKYPALFQHGLFAA